MIYEYPKLESQDQQVIEMIRELRRELRHQVNMKSRALDRLFEAEHLCARASGIK